MYSQMILVKQCLNNSTVESDQDLYKKLLNKFVSKLIDCCKLFETWLKWFRDNRCRSDYVKTGLWGKSSTT